MSQFFIREHLWAFYRPTDIWIKVLDSFFRIFWKTLIRIVAIVCSYLYQIAHLGDDDDEPEFSSAMPLEEGDTFFFAPRQLRNLVLVDELESLSPILGCHIADLGKF